MITLHSLCLIVQDQKIFKEISITCMPAAIVHIKGINGSGKTSLLRMIAGIQTPTEGFITYGKKSIYINKLKKPYCTYIGHKIGLKLEFTVIDNLKYWSDLCDTKNLLDNAITYFQLNKYTNKPCYELSKGTQKKVALSRLIICPSKLWVLDEVDVNLDCITKERLISLITLQERKGGITFISTHSKINTNLTIDMSNYT